MDAIALPEGTDIENPDVERLSTWLVDIAITVYVASTSRNDFILLHGVTSAWSLKQVHFRRDDTLSQI